MELEDTIYQQNTQPMLSHINVGTGVDCSIREMAETMASVVGYQGKIVFDRDQTRWHPAKTYGRYPTQKLGWQHRYNLHEGLSLTYKWFLENIDSFRG